MRVASKGGPRHRRILNTHASVLNHGLLSLVRVLTVLIFKIDIDKLTKVIEIMKNKYIINIV